jgi:Protein of unknown function (DUF3375)
MRSQVSLVELLQAHPLEQGLAELVAYLSLAAADGSSLIDDARHQTLTWTDDEGRGRQATLPMVVYCRPAALARRTGRQQ